jgi:4'-phosphopantetheinyl transferase
MKTSTFWGCPSHGLGRSLSLGVVHVWRAHLDDMPVQATRYYSLLSADERAKAERYRVPHLQNQFIVTRGILRKLLSHYAGVPAAKLRIENNSQGKPALASPSLLDLQFNVSHTSGMALMAFTVEYAVGIDVERTDRVVDDRNIAARCFSSRESAHLMSLLPENRTQEFFIYWTCKEAYFKMRGMGISGGLNQCEIAFDPDGSKADVWLTDGANRKDECSLFRVNGGELHIGALAVERPLMDVLFWDWKV